MASSTPRNPLDFLGIGDKFGPEHLHISTKIFKINRKDKKQERIFLLTNTAIYNIKPSKDAINKIKQYKISPQRRIELTKIASITASTSSKEFTINIPEEYDYRYETFDLNHRATIITAICNAHKALNYSKLSKLKLHIIDDLSTAKFTVTKKDNHQNRYSKRSQIQKLPIALSLSKSELERLEFARATNDKIQQRMGDEAHSKIISQKIDPYIYDYPSLDMTLNVHSERKSDPTVESRLAVDTYSDYLVMGFIRLHIEIEYDDNYKLQYIPQDIKALTKAYFFKFLEYNQYCDVKVQSHIEQTKLSIMTELHGFDHDEHKQQRDIIFGGRMCSSVPFNAYRDQHHMLTVNIIDDGWLPSEESLWGNNDGESGVMCFGLTSNPEEFLEADRKKLFKGGDIKLSVYWHDGTIKIVDNYSGHNTKKEEFGIGCVFNGDIIDIELMEKDLRIYHNTKCVFRLSQARFWREMGNNKVLPDLYWAIAFTVSPRRSVNYYEILIILLLHSLSPSVRKKYQFRIRILLHEINVSYKLTCHINLNLIKSGLWWINKICHSIIC